MVGSECTLIEKAPPGATMMYPQAWPYEWVCRVDGYFLPGFFLSDQLEPIVPDGLLDEIKDKELECV